MADEQEDDLKKLVEQLINEKCIVLMEKLSTDLDYIELDTSHHFYTNVIFHPQKLNKYLIDEISKRIKKKVNDATKNSQNEKIVLLPLTPATGDGSRIYFLHDGINEVIKGAEQKPMFEFVEGIEKLEEGQKVVAVSGNFIGEAIKEYPKEIENKKAELIRLIFILGIPPYVKPSVRTELDKIGYDEIIPINTDAECVDLLLNPKKEGGSAELNAEYPVGENPT
jgi:hypothetical protein